MPFVPIDTLLSDRLTGIYTAAHYGGVITNESLWSSGLARMMISPDAREFAERGHIECATPTPEELAAVEVTLGRMANPIAADASGIQPGAMTYKF